jgi:hypothetical protein
MGVSQPEIGNQDGLHTQNIPNPDGSRLNAVEQADLDSQELETGSTGQFDTENSGGARNPASLGANGGKIVQQFGQGRLSSSNPDLQATEVSLQKDRAFSTFKNPANYESFDDRAVTFDYERGNATGFNTDGKAPLYRNQEWKRVSDRALEEQYWFENRLAEVEQTQAAFDSRQERYHASLNTFFETTQAEIRANMRDSQEEIKQQLGNAQYQMQQQWVEAQADIRANIQNSQREIQHQMGEELKRSLLSEIRDLLAANSLVEKTGGNEASRSNHPGISQGYLARANEVCGQREGQFNGPRP